MLGKKQLSTQLSKLSLYVTRMSNSTETKKGNDKDMSKR
jgi:hypothetical protein